MNKQALYQLAKLLKATKVRQSGNSIMMNCPFAKYLHADGDDKKPSFGIKIGSGIYNCFCCGAKGALTTLPIALYALSNYYDETLVNFIITNQEITDYQDFTPIVDRSELHRLFCSFEDLKQPYLNITLKDIEKWNIKFDKQMSAIVFPIFDQTNSLVALKGRSIVGKKFFYYPNSMNIKKEGIWYGCHIDTPKRKKIILCEGERDAILLSKHKILVWASLGSSITKEQLATIRKSKYEFILFFDNDEAGHKAKQTVIDACRLFNKLYEVTDYQSCKDPAEVVEKGKLIQALNSIKSI